MAPNDIKKMLDARPYVPFRVYMSDGQHYDVLDPDFAFVTRFAMHVGEDFDEERWPKSGRYVRVRHITQLEYLPSEQREGAG